MEYTQQLTADLMGYFGMCQIPKKPDKLDPSQMSGAPDGLWTPYIARFWGLVGEFDILL